MEQKNPVKLPQKEQEILKTIGITKLTWSALKIYNILCTNCRTKVMRNPKLHYDEYCTRCQFKAYNILRSYLPPKPERINIMKAR